MKDGIYIDISNDDYHGNRTHVSSSVLKMAIKDARAYYEKYVLNIDNTPKGLQAAFDFGTYVHARILEPDTVDRDFAIYTGAKRQGKVWDQFAFDNKHKLILTSSQVTKADNMLIDFAQTEVEFKGQNVFLPDMFTGGIAEQSYFTTLHGMEVKARSDYDREDHINDVKTTSSDVSTPEKAREVGLELGYDISAALYIDIVEKLTGIKKDFYFTFLSKKTSGTYIYKASDEFLEGGRKKYIAAIELIKKWRETGVYFTKEIKEM